MNTFLRKRFREQIMVMFGREPKKPEAISEPAQQIHLIKRTSNKEKLQAAAAHAEAHMNTSHKWRNRRWAVLVLVNLFFVFSYYPKYLAKKLPSFRFRKPVAVLRGLTFRF